MKTKLLLWLSCSLALTLTASNVNAGPHRNGGNRSVSRPAGRANVSRTFASGNRVGAWNGQRFSGQRFAGNRNWSANRNWNGAHRSAQNWNNNWSWHHHHHHNNVVFIGDFG